MSDPRTVQLAILSAHPTRMDLVDMFADHVNAMHESVQEWNWDFVTEDFGPFIYCPLPLQRRVIESLIIELS